MSVGLESNEAVQPAATHRPLLAFQFDTTRLPSSHTVAPGALVRCTGVERRMVTFSW